MNISKEKSNSWSWLVWLVMLGMLAYVVWACKMPAPDKKKTARVKNNFIVLVDLSDRLILQPDQPARDKQIIKSLYSMFEEKVKKDLYVKSRDEIKVVIAPQVGSGMKRDVFEDRLYVNMKNLNNVVRKAQEEQRRENFYANLDTLYRKA